MHMDPHGVTPMSAMRTLSLLVAAALSAGVPPQTNYPETEPNETRAAANGPYVLNPGDTLSGESHGTSFFGTIVANGSFDYFNIAPAATAPAIYRNYLTVDSPAACAVITIGFGQIDGAVNYRGSPIESNGVISSTSSTGGTLARTGVWYTFGPASPVNLRIQNATITTANNYVATFT